MCILEATVLEGVKMVDCSGHVKVSVLVRKLNSRVSDISPLRIVVVTSTREHTGGTVDREHVKDERGRL
jgi:hypothetical protein